jgi:hypothetical protein
MNLQLAELGAASPTILHLPADVHSLDAAVEAIELGESYGLTLDPDQRATLVAALGERADGSWAAGEVGDFKGRQAGKNDTLKVRQLAGLVLFGERLIIHTAHEFPTANEDFLRFVAVLEAYDDLRKKVARIRYANGEQGVEFINGARLKYRARTASGGRGFTDADLVVYDEAQHLQPEQVASSLPTLLANPNFQAWYCGSGGFVTSVIAHSIRRQALLGSHPRLAYTENTAQVVAVEGGRIAVSDPSPDVLLSPDTLAVHPGYAHGRVAYETFELMLNRMGPERYAREVLCCWEPLPDDDASVPVPPSVWDGLHDPSSSIESAHVLALDVESDRSRAAFGVAGRRRDGHMHVEVMDTRPNPAAWVVARAVEIHRNSGGVPVRIQRGSPAASYIDDLLTAGVEVVEVSREDAARAAGQFIDACQAGVVHHLGQGSLTTALRNAVLQPSGESAVWGRRKSKYVSPLVACTLALGGVSSYLERVSPGFVSLSDL